MNAPFKGPIFDQMFSEAVETVTDNLLKALKEDRSSLKNKVSNVMTSALQLTAFDNYAQFSFEGDNSVLINSVASSTGIDSGLTETILSEVYTDSSTGEIPAWFLNPTNAVAQVATAKREGDALTPSFFQRVAGTILAPLGVTGHEAIMILYGIAAVVVLVAVAYFIRSFK